MATICFQERAMSAEAFTLLLNLPHLKVTTEKLPDDDAVVLDVKPTLKVALCPNCGYPSHDLHDYDEPRLIRDLPLSGRQCFLRMRGRRFDCERCSRPFTERLEWIEFDSSYTKRFEGHIFELCRKNTVQEVSRIAELGYDAVEGIFTRLAKKT
jgi:transposase